MKTKVSTKVYPLKLANEMLKWHFIKELMKSLDFTL